MTRRMAAGRVGLAAALLVGTGRFAAGACGVTQVDLENDGNPDLRIQGTSGPQTLSIVDNGTDVVLSLNCNNDADYTDLGEVDGVSYPGIETLSVALGGRDTITYTQGAVLSGVHRYLLLALGPSGNTVTFDGAGFGLQSNASLVVDVTGASHADTVTVDYSGTSVTDSLLVIRGDLAAGPDPVTVLTPQATNSHVEIDLMGNLGNNVLAVNVDEPVTGSLVRATLEGSNVTTHSDATTVRLAAPVDGGSRVLLTYYLRAGLDALSADVDPAAFSVASGGEVRLHAYGGLHDDDLLVDTGTVGGPAAVDGLVEVVLRGGPGNDTINFGWYGLTGGGTCRLRANGGVNPDTVLAAVLADGTSTNTLDWVVQGGRGPDFLYTAVFESGSGLSYFGGPVVLDGDTEKDVCVPFGDGALEVLSCEPAS